MKACDRHASLRSYRVQCQNCLHLHFSQDLYVAIYTDLLVRHRSEWSRRSYKVEICSSGEPSCILYATRIIPVIVFMPRTHYLDCSHVCNLLFPIRTSKFNDEVSARLFSDAVAVGHLRTYREGEDGKVRCDQVTIVPTSWVLCMWDAIQGLGGVYMKMESEDGSHLNRLKACLVSM
nr:hypothetical protein CFP56_33491 [Quercus suber]